MLLRSLLSLSVVCLAIGTLWAANDPFVGKWKVNPSKSTLTDEMKVEAMGENKYTITFSPDAVDTIVADGTNQPALSGTTLSITVKGPNSWEIIRKMNRYSSLGAMKLIDKRVSMGSALAHAIWSFLKHFLVKRGYKDGWAGFVIALGNFEGTFYRYAKRHEADQHWTAPPSQVLRREPES